MPRRKVKLVEVEEVDWATQDAKYDSSYHGNVVKDSSNTYWYFETSGRMNWGLCEELANLLIGKEVKVIEVVEKDDSPVAVATNNISLIDSIGAKPKSVNIEF